MKKNPVFLFLLALFLVSCTSEPPAMESSLPSEEEAIEVVMEKIEMAAEKWSTGDPMGYVEVAAPDITWSDDLAAPVPISTKEALKVYLEGFRGQIPPHKFELSEFTYQFYEDIIIVTYHYQGTFDEVKAPPWKVTSVYRFENGDWLSVHENWTNVKTEEQAAS
jgi:hypothetical protein